MKKYLSILLLLISALLFTACDLFGNGGDNDGDGGEGSSSDTVIKQEDISTLKTNIVNSDAAESYPVVSYSDGVYNYFYFKIGEIKNAPIYFENANAHEGIVDMNFKWEESSSVESKLSQATSNCISNTVSTQLKASIQTKLNGQLSAKAFSASASVSAGLEASLSNSTTASTSNTATESVSNIVSNKHTTSFVLDKSCPQGYYRYTVCADCDIYAVVRAEIGSADKSFTYSYLSFTKGNYSEGIFYSPTADFGSDNEETLSLNTELLDNLDLFSDYLPLLTPDEAVEYKNEEKWTIDDTGEWGLEKPHQTETLDLSALAPYMNNSYDFIFEITVNIKEKYSGYQEVLLYNQWNDMVKNSEGTNTETAMSKYGVLDVKTFTHGDGPAYDHKFTFTVDGEKCREEMYIRYDAHGDYEDTWYRNSIYVTVKAVPKN